MASMILGAVATPPSLAALYVGIVISPVYGILAGMCCLLLVLPAMVLGVMAIMKIRRSNGRLYGIGCAIPGVALVPVLSAQAILGFGLVTLTAEIGSILLAVAYIGATTAFILHGIWHWLTLGGSGCRCD